MVPHVCSIMFVNQLSKVETLFQTAYIKLIGNLYRDVVMNSGRGTKDEIFQDFNRIYKDKYAERLGESENHVFPQHVIARSYVKQTTFHCVIKVQFITLTWTLDGVSKLHSGIIYQKESGISKNFFEFFAMNTSQVGQHSLVILHMKPVITGTYTCVVTYQNQTTLSYSAELVLANMQEPMSLKYTANRLQSIFRCSLRYCGKMQPFLRCENQLDQHGIVTRVRHEKLVVFEKVMNLTRMPIVCSLWMKHTKGEEIFFKAPTQFTGQAVGLSGHLESSNSIRLPVPGIYLSCIILLAILEIFLEFRM